ncbi:response regulator [Natrarchaeobius chitinivorans]|uniref:Response regulator n=1 Tax=Natrarchaeobius chitinivorans TaxID=1679083 RepID=A0A3N6M475_NATCH|nr:response regulator [Natrarchaeobius chitinivorans]RQG90750.1 response regulator [Natrarchaeobius chitinivorans]
MSQKPHVLVVDDQEPLTDLYARWLESDYQVSKAYDGEEAVQKLGSDVDVVLLDRRMPEISGDDVLQTIRENDLDCRIAMVTAVSPDFDIFDLGFDDYLEKPVSEHEVKSSVEKLLRRSEYSSQLQKYFTLVAQKSAIKAEKSQNERENNETYQELSEKVDTLQSEVERSRDQLDEEDLNAIIHDIP